MVTKNKKGFIRTLEAVIAIILILGFIFWITPKVVEFEEKVPENVANAKDFILNQILSEKEYSECVLFASEGECESVLSDSSEGSCKDIIINELIEDNIPHGYSYHCEICSSSGSCTNLPEPDKTLKKSVYTGSIFVYGSSTNYKVFRIYIWEK